MSDDTIHATDSWYANNKFNLCDYGHPNTSSTLYAHSYVEKCKQLILMKSANKTWSHLSSVDELKRFIAKKAPLVTFHEDIDQMLEKIIKKHQLWYAWYVNCDENEKAKYLSIDSDWKRVLCFQPQTTETIQMQLDNCDCPAHHIWFIIERKVPNEKFLLSIEQI